MSTFEEFLAACPVYGELCRELESADFKLAFAATAVHAVHGDELARVAPPLIGYARRRFGADLAARYAERSRHLEQMQRQFDRDPRVETLGRPDQPIDREAYHIALLLSIVFTNHRFEIMLRLEEFFANLPSRGRLAGLGTGTGYELMVAAGKLPGWELESYDIDAAAEGEARRLLEHFETRTPIGFARELPLAAPERTLLGRYDAIVACEVLEHLPDPAGALSTMREYLTDRGRMFVTMAVNIAQEDHIFLYPDLATCRRQLSDCSLRVVEEWITPQTLWPPPADREKDFKRGNYIAVVEKMV
jgi:SAM-dependent methyltransferase